MGRATQWVFAFGFFIGLAASQVRAASQSLTTPGVTSPLSINVINVGYQDAGTICLPGTGPDQEACFTGGTGATEGAYFNSRFNIRHNNSVLNNTLMSVGTAGSQIFGVTTTAVACGADLTCTGAVSGAGLISTGANHIYMNSGAALLLNSPTSSSLLRDQSGNVEIHSANDKVGVELGTSTGQTTLGGVINANSTAVGNAGASGPDDLITYTLPASAIVTTTRGVRITAWGTCANNANAKTFTLNFGSQVVLTHDCTASIANERWKISSIVLRTGASAQDWFSDYTGNTGVAGAFEYDPEIGTATQTETGTIVVKMQSTTSTNDNDIVQEGMIIEYL